MFEKGNNSSDSDIYSSNQKTPRVGGDTLHVHGIECGQLDGIVLRDDAMLLYAGNNNYLVLVSY